MDDAQAWAFEERFWTGGASVYGGLVDPARPMAFPGTGVMRAADILESLEGAPRWASVEMTDRAVGRAGDGVLVLGHAADGRREGAAPYRCLCTPTYRRADGGVWKLVQHQQTPAGRSRRPRGRDTEARRCSWCSAACPARARPTVARIVAARRGAACLRADAIEQALRSAGVLAAGDGVGPAGCMAACALAAENLRPGLAVVADCVNPLAETRAAWRSVAAPGPIIELELVCADTAEHRRRVENRASDLPGLVPPAWASVARHEYEPWTEPRLVLDAAALGAEEAASRVCAEIAARRRRRDGGE